MKFSKHVLRVIKKTNAMVATFFFVFYPLYPVLTIPVAHASDDVESSITEAGAVVVESLAESPASTDVPVPTEMPTIESSVSPEPSVSPSVETIATPEPSVESLLPASPEPSPVVSPEPSTIAVVNSEPTNTADGIWQIMPNGKAQTRSVVSMSETYVAPQNEKVTVKFTQLPDNPGVLTINEVKLSTEEQAQLGAVSDTAYDITSTMPDGSFKYDLTLPKPEDAKDVQIKFAETKTDLMAAAQDVTQKTEEATDVVIVTSLNHFTVFVLTVPSDNSGSGWDNPENGYASDDQYVTTNAQDKNADFKSFNLNIPSSAVIEGIEVLIEGKTTGRQISIDLYKDSTHSGTAKVSTTFDATDKMVTFGSPTDLWGLTGLTASNFSNTNFKVRIRSQHFTPSGTTFSLDQVQVKVHYSASTTITITSNTNPSAVGNSVTFTATVTGSGVAPTGIVTFKNGASTLGTGTLSGSGASTTATYSTSALSVGSHSITAVYNNGNVDGNSGNYDSSTSSVLTQVVNDTTAPVIAAHSSVTAEATSSSGAVVTYTNPTATDNVDPSVTVTCAPDSGSTFPIGSTTVTCNATDTAENHATPTTFLVTVGDTVAPAIDNVIDITMEATSTSGATATFTAPMSHDVVDGDIVSTCDAVSGSTFPIGVTTVTCSKTDAAGNTAVPETFTITIQDTTAPTYSWNKPVVDSIYKDGASIDIDATITENGSGIVDGASCNPAIHTPVGYFTGTVTYSATTNKCTGTITLNTPSGLGDGTHHITLSISDKKGNSVVSSDRNIQIDNTPPQITSTETQDEDGDGKIDTIELGFDEIIDHSRLAPSGNDGWSVDGYTVSKVDTENGTDDTILLLTLVEGSDSDSGNTPTITYTQDLTPPTESTHDIAGNELVTGSWTPTDDAKPVVLSAETQDVNGNGKIDNIKLTFSENIDDDRLQIGTADGWGVDDYSGESIGSGSVEDDNILLLGFTEGASYDVDVTPDISYTRQEVENSTHDIAGNELADYSETTTDKAAPTAPTANPVGGGYYADQSVTLTGESGADIRYTTDGTDPSASSAKYDTSILINHSQTLNAIAIDPSGNVSPKMTEEYGIAPIISPESVINGTTGNPGTEQVITWDTDDLSTSRVVYGLESVSTPGSAPNYGYRYSTDTFNLAPDKVTHHVVTLTGLQPDKVYYYRVISAGSPENYSAEMDFKTGTDHETADSSGSAQSASTSVVTASKVLGITKIAQSILPTLQPTVFSSTKTSSGTTNSSASSSPSPENTPEKGTVEAATLDASSSPTQENSQKGIQVKWWWYLIALIIIVAGVYYYNRQIKNKQK